MPVRFSQFSGCWLILSVYILMSFDSEFGNFVITLIYSPLLSYRNVGDLRNPHYRSHARDPMLQPMKMAMVRMWTFSMLICMLREIWLDGNHVTHNRVSSDLPLRSISVKRVKWEIPYFNQINTFCGSFFTNNKKCGAATLLGFQGQARQ